MSKLQDRLWRKSRSTISPRVICGKDNNGKPIYAQGVDSNRNWNSNWNRASTRLNRLNVFTHHLLGFV